MYWFMAHSFGFTPEQVDEIPFDRLIYMQSLEVEYKKLEKKNDRL